jgi:hypothetical protein
MLKKKKKKTYNKTLKKNPHSDISPSNAGQISLSSDQNFLIWTICGQNPSKNGLSGPKNGFSGSKSGFFDQKAGNSDQKRQKLDKFPQAREIMCRLHVRFANVSLFEGFFGVFGRF